MSEEETTTTEEVEKTVTTEVKTELEENVTEAPKTEATVTTTAKSSDKTSLSIGTGLTVYNGGCKLCGAQVCNGIVKEDGKISCPTCKRDF